MNYNNYKTKQIIGFLLLFSILAPVLTLSFIPRQAKAQGFPVGDTTTEVQSVLSQIWNGITSTGTVTNTAISVKKVAIDIAHQILMTVARRLLQDMTKSTINWINTGYYKNPLFLENPGSFFKDIAKYEVKTLVDEFGYDSRRFPFGKDFALNTINTYKRTLTDNAQYTLSRVMTDPVLLKNYQNDFNAGGWNGFLINTQYPQNNYLGFQMIATEQLAQKIQGTAQTATQKVQTILQQGMGFLSPQSCSTNSNYNSLKNEFNAPKFDAAKFSSDYYRAHPSPTSQTAAETAQWETNYQNALNRAKTGWDNPTNPSVCPLRPDGSSGLVATTPGSVVANKIMGALNMPEGSTLQAMGLGNSISAIFDSLLNHFIGNGLNSLASTTNPAAPVDTWKYDGQTLGSVVSYNNSAWDAGPDQPIILREFKKAVDEGITNTQTELVLIDNGNPYNPGVTQLFTSIWTKTRELDICQPGPNIGWQSRTDEEEQRNEILFSDKLSDSDGETATAAKLVQGELKFAANFFKDWINNQMMTALPNSINYMDSIDALPAVQQQADELISAERLKKQALARLKSIKIILNGITDQPDIGSGKEKTLVDLAVQYRATNDNISNSTTIANRQDELNRAKEQSAQLTTQTNECDAERKANGWSVPADGNYSNFNGASSTFSGRSASLLFCTENASIEVTKPLPVTMTPGQNYNFTLRVANTGESYWHHGDYFQFVKKSGNINISPSFGGLPYPVAANFSDPSLRYVDWSFGITAPSTPGNYSFDMQMVHKKGGAYIRLLDDTKTPRTTDVCANTTPTSDVYFGNSVNISMSVVSTPVLGTQIQNVLSTITFTPTPTPTTPFPPSPSGKEEELFCDRPIAGGYDHEMFKHSNDQGGHGILGRGNIPGGNGTVTYPEIPYVNADDVMKWRTVGSTITSAVTTVLCLGFCGSDTYHHVDMELSCNIIYKANVLDYKGNLPGGTPVLDTYTDSYEVDTSGSLICLVPNGQYDGDLRTAMDSVVSESPNLANVPYTPDSGRAFLGAVAIKLQSSGFNATIDVLNGHDIHGSSGDLIALWKNGDSKMERYDALTSGAGNIVDHLATQFTGQIPLTCTYTGGGNHCKCEEAPAPPPSGGGGCTAANEHPPLTPTDDTSIARYVNASFKGWNGHDDTASDIAYWVGVSDHYGSPFSNGQCYIGWNAYWEARMQPGNAGSADPNLGGQPARFQP